MNDKQYAFCKSHSTTNLLIFLTNSIHHKFVGYGKTHLTALGISKAFDRVWHKELLLKISPYRLSPLPQDIKSLLTDRKIRVILDGSHYSWHHIIAGIPQESVWASSLFLININELLNFTANSLRSCADDSLLHTSFCFLKRPS